MLCSFFRSLSSIGLKFKVVIVLDKMMLETDEVAKSPDFPRSKIWIIWAGSAGTLDLLCRTVAMGEDNER